MKKNSTSNSIDINHAFQTDGNLCGPACIYMVREAMIVHNHLRHISYEPMTIEEIGQRCTTDWVVGSPPDKMMLGMNSLDIKYVHHETMVKPYKYLRGVINYGHVPMLRTITQGVPHWIIVKAYDGDKFLVLDPWLGEIKYTQEELDDVWKKRDYEFFEVSLETTDCEEEIGEWVEDGGYDAWTEGEFGDIID